MVIPVLSLPGNCHFVCLMVEIQKLLLSPPPPLPRDCCSEADHPTTKSSPPCLTRRPASFTGDVFSHRHRLLGVIRRHIEVVAFFHISISPPVNCFFPPVFHQRARPGSNRGWSGVNGVGGCGFDPVGPGSLLRLGQRHSNICPGNFITTASSSEPFLGTLSTIRTGSELRSSLWTRQSRLRPVV